MKKINAVAGEDEYNNYLRGSFKVNFILFKYIII